MKLIEALKTIARYQLITDRDNLGEYHFTVNKYTYSVLFSKYSANNYFPEHWEVSFSIIKPEYRIDLTGTGNQFIVLSTVIHICKEWFNSHPPRCIIATAKDDSRKTLYPKLLRYIVPPDWDVSINGDTIITQKPKVSFLKQLFAKH